MCVPVAQQMGMVVGGEPNALESFRGESLFCGPLKLGEGHFMAAGYCFLKV